MFSAICMTITFSRKTNTIGTWARTFSANIFPASEVQHKVVFGLLKMIENDSRLGEAVDRTLFSHTLKMFTALGIYPEIFEKPFLEGTSEFYGAESVKYMRQER